uniref:Uncharacterized protein n=1 Tax=Knipowitschia caucasica TaxID=637954 RepID=A0AAV2L5T5_KNICA
MPHPLSILIVFPTHTIPPPPLDSSSPQPLSDTSHSVSKVSSREIPSAYFSSQITRNPKTPSLHTTQDNTIHTTIPGGGGGPHEDPSSSQYISYNPHYKLTLPQHLLGTPVRQGNGRKKSVHGSYESESSKHLSPSSVHRLPAP